MARQRGCGSFPKTRARNLHSAPSKIGIRIMLRPHRFFLYVSLFSALALLLVCLPGQTVWAQNTDDDVHIKPRIAPKPASADEIKESGFASHDRPLKVSVDLVLVPVTITDPMNRLVTGLDKDNFAVFEGKSAQEIRSFSSEDAPVSLGVIFDMSRSMSSKIER